MNERERIITILEMVREARLCDEVAESLILEGKTVEEANQKVQDLVDDYNLKIQHYSKNEDTDFFVFGNTTMKDPESFIQSIVGLYLQVVYGELVFTKKPTLNFIDVYEENDGSFTFSDATFINRYKGSGKLYGTIIPKKISYRTEINFTAPKGNEFTKFFVNKGFIPMYIDSEFSTGKTIEEFQNKYREQIVHLMGELFAGNPLVVKTNYEEIIMQVMFKGQSIPAHSDANADGNFLFNAISHGAERGTKRELIFGQRDQKSLLSFLKGTALKDSSKYMELSTYTPDLTVHPTKDTLIFINSFNPFFVHEVKELKNDTSVYTIVSNMRL